MTPTLSAQSKGNNCLPESTEGPEEKKITHRGETHNSSKMVKVTMVTSSTTGQLAWIPVRRMVGYVCLPLSNHTIPF